MSRLIDADELMKDIIRRFGCKPYIEVGLICEYVHDIIDSQPTAFDMENVVEQLETLHDLVNINQKLAVSQSIDIVKKGGVE